MICLELGGTMKVVKSSEFESMQHTLQTETPYKQYKRKTYFYYAFTSITHIYRAVSFIFENKMKNKFINGITLLFAFYTNLSYFLSCRQEGVCADSNELKIFLLRVLRRDRSENSVYFLHDSVKDALNCIERICKQRIINKPKSSAMCMK